MDDANTLGTFLRNLGIDSEDTSANRLWLPSGADDALTLGSPIHDGSHPHYTNFVAAKLQEIKDKYDVDVDRLGSNAAGNSARADIRQLQAVIPELLQKIYPDTNLPLLTINNPDPRFEGQLAQSSYLRKYHCNIHNLE